MADEHRRRAVWDTLDDHRSTPVDDRYVVQAVEGELFARGAVALFGPSRADVDPSDPLSDTERVEFGVAPDVEGDYGVWYSDDVAAEWVRLPPSASADGPVEGLRATDQAAAVGSDGHWLVFARGPEAANEVTAGVPGGRVAETVGVRHDLYPKDGPSDAVDSPADHRWIGDGEQFVVAPQQVKAQPGLRFEIESPEGRRGWIPPRRPRSWAEVFDPRTDDESRPRGEDRGSRGGHGR